MGRHGGPRDPGRRDQLRSQCHVDKAARRGAQGQPRRLGHPGGRVEPAGELAAPRLPGGPGGGGAERSALRQLAGQADAARAQGAGARGGVAGGGAHRAAIGRKVADEWVIPALAFGPPGRGAGVETALPASERASATAAGPAAGAQQAARGRSRSLLWRSSSLLAEPVLWCAPSPRSGEDGLDPPLFGVQMDRPSLGDTRRPRVPDNALLRRSTLLPRRR
mmetsp:Transcript_42006/g.139621  ORF Transcript_42006/g.139621 Transcript_42006/m.139621 type:complete len:221 (-) Transcript_42006:409-1071(-)